MKFFRVFPHLRAKNHHSDIGGIRIRDPLSITSSTLLPLSYEVNYDSSVDISEPYAGSFDTTIFKIFKCNDCGNIATRVYSMFIDEVLPSFSTLGERKIIISNRHMVSKYRYSNRQTSYTVARWLERLTSPPKVADSNPTEVRVMFFALPLWKDLEEAHRESRCKKQ